MFEMHLISGITDEPPPLAKLNVQTGAQVACILVFTILSVSVDYCYLRFWECFPVISGFV